MLKVNLVIQLNLKETILSHDKLISLARSWQPSRWTCFKWGEVQVVETALIKQILMADSTLMEADLTQMVTEVHMFLITLVREVHLSLSWDSVIEITLIEFQSSLMLKMKNIQETIINQDQDQVKVN